MNKEMPHIKIKLGEVMLAAVLVAPAALRAEGLELQEVTPPGQAELARVPKNLARWHMGTTLTLADGTRIEPGTADTFPQYALLGDDETQLCDLPAGRTELVMEMAEFHRLSNAFLRSYGAVGTLGVAVSNVPLAPGAPGWESVAEGLRFDAARPADASFAAVEGKFVRLTFDVTRPGPVGSLSLTGDTSVAETPFQATQYDIEQVRNLGEDQVVGFDFGSLYAGSAVTLVSGGRVEGAQAMIDDDMRTEFSFPPGPSQGVMLRLDQTALLDEVSLLLNAGAGRLGVYTFAAQPPGLQAGEGGLITLPEDFAVDNPPRHVFEFDGPTSRASVALDNVEAQYVLLLWEAADPAQPLSISEISVIGPVPDTLRPVGYTEDFQFADTAPTVPPGPPAPVLTPRIEPNSF